MITNFEKFNENADTIGVYFDADQDGYDELVKRYSYKDSDARAFFVTVNSDHTKVEKLYIGGEGDCHKDLEYDEDEEKMYPGRLWLKGKIMAFWIYPNEVLFADIIKKLEKELRRKIFNNRWRIEVIEKKNKIKRKKYKGEDEDYYGTNHEYGQSHYKIIPLDNYIGSENPPEEAKIQHLMNWKEKALAKKQGELNMKGWGSDKTAWDSPHNIQWRQAIYQEKKE